MFNSILNKVNTGGGRRGPVQVHCQQHACTLSASWLQGLLSTVVWSSVLSPPFCFYAPPCDRLIIPPLFGGGVGEGIC